MKNNELFRRACERLAIAQHLGIFRDGMYTPCNGISDEAAARIEVNNCLWYLSQIH